VGALALTRVFIRSLVLQASWNRKGMQNLGFAFAIYPALARLYRGDALRAAVQRHMAFFNSHPYMAAAILGGAIHVEERVARGEDPPESVDGFKRALMGSFAAIGDGFFWASWRPAAALAAVLATPWLGGWSVLLFLALYDAVHLPLRAWMFLAGYRRGEGVVEALGRVHLPTLALALKAANAAMAGAAGAVAAVVAARGAGIGVGAACALAAAAAWALLPRAGLYPALYAGAAVAGAAALFGGAP
jgi:PTS system mannose-specific IID component